MQFYRIRCKIYGGNMDEIAGKVSGESRKQDIWDAVSEFTNSSEKKESVFMSLARGSVLVIGVAAESLSRAEELVSMFLKYLELDENNISKEFAEQTFEAFSKLVTSAHRRGLLDEGTDIIESLGLSGIERNGRFGLFYGENLLEETSREICEEKARRYVMDATMIPELDRIYAETGKTKTKVQGHPVHYMISTDDLEIRRETCRSLLSALYGNGRIRNRRYVFMDIDPNGRFAERFLSDIYDSSEGGAVVLRFGPSADQEEDEYADSARDLAEAISKIVAENRHKVLTLLCFPRECTRIKGYFEACLPGMSFVMLSEEMVNGDKAKTYLKGLCSEYGVRADKALLSKAEGEERYLAVELRAVFDRWYDKKIKKDCYPQYREVAAERELIAKEKPKGNAAEELEEMIGLTEAKRVIKEALDYFKAQKLFAEMGMVTERPSMHMVFTGNPGSAKTTVARLFARILRDNGILSKGQLLELGRGDLVGKYVGHTAPLVKQRFHEASGGVLFVDEAYSLVDDRDGLYGDEALAAICQEMENHRDDCVVIFAGYPDKMEAFLQKNPGLRSRISFHVPFEDYDREELLDIAKLISKKKGMNLTLGAQKKLGGIFEEARKESDFGNGRFVRNILEQAKMTHASRLLGMDLEKITKNDVKTITEEDIIAPKEVNKEVPKVIGFCG